MDGESENPMETELASALCRGKSAFFGYFLCGGKESNSPKAKAFDLREDPSKRCITAFVATARQAVKAPKCPPR